MSDINSPNEQNEQQHQPQQVFTREEVERIVKELESTRIREKEERINGSELPFAIKEALDESTTAQLKENFKLFRRSTQKYNDEYWTKNEQVNKELIPELKNWKVDTYQFVNTIYKFAETTRIQARANTELYQQLLYLQSKATFISTGDQDILNDTITQAERLAVFGFGTAKFQEQEARDASIKALKLPSSIKYLDTSATEENGKQDAFDVEFIKELHKARFEEKVIKDSVSNNNRGGYYNNRGYNHGYRGRNSGSRGGSWRGSFSSRGQSFYSGGRGRGASFLQHRNTITSTPTTNNTSNNDNN